MTEPPYPPHPGPAGTPPPPGGWGPPPAPAPYPAAQYGQHPYGQYQAAPYPDGQYPAAPYPYGQYPAAPYPYGQYPAAPYPYGQHPVPLQPAPLPPRPSALPDGPREYPQMLRGPRRRWWKPLLSLPLVLVIALAGLLAAYLPVLGIAVLAGVPDPISWTGREIAGTQVGPAQFLWLCLGLAALIPAAMWGIWAVYGIRPRFVSSVVGGVRWRWGLRCVLVLIPVFIVFLAISLLLDFSLAPPPAQWGLLLAVVLLVMPFQAAGEEYFFRGWLLQNVGSWFRRPIVALVAGTVVSAALFSAAHGSADPWIVADLVALSVAACLLTWRTGGLEAAVALHAVNNVGVSILSLATGSWEESFIDTTSAGTPSVFAMSLLLDIVVVALIWWQAERVGLQRRYQPPARPAALPTRPPEPALALPPSAS